MNIFSPRHPDQLESQLIDAMRMRQFARSTQKTYICWYRWFVRFHRLKHPNEMGADEIEAFLTHLARNRGVARSTQNQALNALIFLYRHVLRIEVEGIQAFRARSHRQIPVVLTTDEVRRVLESFDAGCVWALQAALIYGCGLRVNECMALRIKDVDPAARTLSVREAKGNKSRMLTLPNSTIEHLERQTAYAHNFYEQDRIAEAPGVELPHAMGKKSLRLYSPKSQVVVPGVSKGWRQMGRYRGSRGSFACLPSKLSSITNAGLRLTRESRRASGSDRPNLSGTRFLPRRGAWRLSG